MTAFGWAFLCVTCALLAFAIGRASAKQAQETKQNHSKSDDIDLVLNIVEKHASSEFYIETRNLDENQDQPDAWEGGFWEASDPKKLGAHVEIEYVDGKSQATKRIVHIREFDNKLHGGIFIGDCELRNAKRTFRYDRVTNAVDIETGEHIDDISLFLNSSYDASPEKTIEILVSDYIDILKVLYFVAKADGQYRKEEKVVITEYLKSLLRDDRITIKLVDDELRYMDIPSLQAFKNALGRVIRGGQIDPYQLQACCKDIVATQKTIHPSELAALDYIEKKIASRKGVGDN